MLTKARCGWLLVYILGSGVFSQHRSEGALNYVVRFHNFREVNSSTSYAEGLQVQTEHENSLKQLF